MKQIFILTLLVGLMSAAVFGTQFAPVINAKVMGGQYGFEQENSDTGGNINLNIIPALKFSDNFSFLPIYYFEYRSVKDATELVGGDTLITQRMSHNFTVKPIVGISDSMKLKLKAGYMMQYLKESADENLSDGAFNYNKTTVGIDFAGESYTAGYSMYMIKFPNYQSMAETKYGAELLGKVGENILDFTAHDVTLMKKLRLGAGFVLDTTLNYTMKMFADQKVVIKPVASNEVNYSDDTRSDSSILVNLFPSAAIVPTGPTTLFGGLSITAISYASNQNHTDIEDSSNYQYFASYYNYFQYKVRPVINLSFNKIPLQFNFSYEYAVKQYSDRLAQKEQDPTDSTKWLYSTDKTSITTGYLALNISYPVFEGFNVNLNPSFFTSSSNMKNETSYAYNYNTNNYFLGITYAYR